MDQPNNAFISLLRSVLCGEAIDRAYFPKFDEDQLKELYQMSKAHDLAHLIGAALEKSGLLTDSEISKKLTKNQLLAVYRYENQSYELSAIKSIFENIGIDFIPLKGAVIREKYPEPWMRTSCDIDVLVKRCDIDRAVEALVESLGYEKDTKKNFHDVSLYSPSGVHLELHFTLEENIAEVDGTLSRVWDYASPAQEGLHEYRLSKEFFVYHLITHASYHFVNGGCGVRPLIDVWLVTVNDDYDRDVLNRLLQESHLEVFGKEFIALSRIWFGNGEYSATTKRMEDYILWGGIYGSRETRIAAKREARGGRFGYLLSRIFVSYDHLRARYPSLNRRELAPFYQVRRWFELITKKRLSSSLWELDVNMNLDEGKVDGVTSLMRDLQLNNMIK